MFTTKYHKNQKPMRKVKKYEGGGYVESGTYLEKIGPRHEKTKIKNHRKMIDG